MTAKTGIDLWGHCLCLPSTFAEMTRRVSLIDEDQRLVFVRQITDFSAKYKVSINMPAA